ncbi:unnamed protein product [Lactuca saligna]|uniref:Uncharacterized protein n=1 Tax=Lactuca saligna TaxID=75948 RepID=A0AA36EB84_LACSI|nr:unnamed protein product [Lactuca saligna]
MNGQGSHEGTRWRLRGPMDSDRLQAEVASSGSIRPKRRRNEAASSCFLSFGCEVRSLGVESSSSIEDETFGGLWSMGTVEKESEGRRTERESGIIDRWCFCLVVRCEGMGFGVAKRLRWEGGQDRVRLEQGNQVERQPRKAAALWSCRKLPSLPVVLDTERRKRGGVWLQLEMMVIKRCWSVVLLLLERSMEGNGSKQTHIWCWYDAVG